jgi:hypothetical protein
VWFRDREQTGRQSDLTAGLTTQTYPGFDLETFQAGLLPLVDAIATSHRGEPILDY